MRIGHVVLNLDINNSPGSATVDYWTVDILDVVHMINFWKNITMDILENCHKQLSQYKILILVSL